MDCCPRRLSILDRKSAISQKAAVKGRRLLAVLYNKTLIYPLTHLHSLCGRHRRSAVRERRLMKVTSSQKTSISATSGKNSTALCTSNCLNADRTRGACVKSLYSTFKLLCIWAFNLILNLIFPPESVTPICDHPVAHCNPF